MIEPISSNDRLALRALASEYRAIAESPAMAENVKNWTWHGAFSPDSRPPVTIELQTFEQVILPPLTRCEGESARIWEKQMLRRIVPSRDFGDDTILSPYMPFRYTAEFVPFGLPVRETLVVSPASETLGHHFEPYLTDFAEECGKLGTSRFCLHPKAETYAVMDSYNDVCGDILPAKLICHGLRSVPLRDFVHIMPMETLFFALMDAPEEFCAAMDRLTDDYVRYFHALGEAGYLDSTAREQVISQCSYGFTDKLPDSLSHYAATDLWGFMDAQEATGVSPDMFDELIFPYYQKVMKAFGRMSFGCCEAVHPFWEKSLSRIENLGKISISPWCNQEYMGEMLRGSEIIFHRKPTPNLLSSTGALDEDAVRADARRTVAASRGCHLEIVQRDVYRIYADARKVRRYIQIYQEACAEHQN